MSEPHELEERAAMAHFEAYMEGLIPCCEEAWEKQPMQHRERMCRAMSAALALVRQEQEKDANAAMIDSAVLTFVRENGGIEHAPAITWRVMIRAWWLSHTAPQEK